MTDYSVFERCGNEMATRLYKYTVIAYRHGTRIVFEVRTANEVKESTETDAHSVGVVITPNGIAWTREKFLEAWEIAVGLVVPEPTTNLVRTLQEGDTIHG